VPEHEAPGTHVALVGAYGQAGAPQGAARFFRNCLVDTFVVGISEEDRSITSRPERQTSGRLRRTKLVGALAVAALVGIGSYAATYHALVLISVPATATGSVVSVTSGSAPTATVPSTAASAHPLR
jgi:hypothetical protein